MRHKIFLCMHMKNFLCAHEFYKIFIHAHVDFSSKFHVFGGGLFFMFLGLFLTDALFKKSQIYCLARGYHPKNKAVWQDDWHGENPKNALLGLYKRDRGGVVLRAVFDFDVF